MRLISHFVCLFLASFFLFSCKKECCLESPLILAYIDMNVHKGDYNPENENVTKIENILTPIKKRYLSNSETICPISVLVYPLYYRSGDEVEIYKFLQPAKDNCNLPPSDISTRKIRFNGVKKQYEGFQERYLGLKNGESRPRYKTIWPSLNVLTERILNSHVDTITIIYYSDFLELRDPPSWEEGRFLFAKSDKGKDQMVCDFKAINEAYDSLEREEDGLLLRQLHKMRAKLQNILSHKVVKVFFVECDSLKEVKYDVRSSEGIYDKFDYWEMVFKFLGFNSINRIDVDEIELHI